MGPQGGKRQGPGRRRLPAGRHSGAANVGSGFIIGGLWGLIVSAGALAIASLMGEPPRVPQAGPEVVQRSPGDAPAVAGDAPDEASPGAVPPAGADPETLAEMEPAPEPVPEPAPAPEPAPNPAATPGRDAAPDRPTPAPGLASPAPVAPQAPALDPGVTQTARPADAPSPETGIVIETEGEAEILPGTPEEEEAIDLPAPPVSAEAPEPPEAQSLAMQPPEAPRAAPRDGAAPQTPRADVPAGRGRAPSADTAPLQRPRTDAAIAPPATEIARLDPPRLDLGAEEPVLPGPPSRVIEIPAEEADITVATEPPPAPSAEPRVVVDEGAPEAGDESVAMSSPGAAVPSATEAGEAEETGEALARASRAADGTPLRVPLPRARPAALPDEPGTITVLPESEAPALPGQPAGLDEDAVAVRRAGASGEAQGEARAAPEPAPEFDDDAPALLRFAAADTAEGGMPRLSVVLIDDGEIDEPVAAASSIPFPVTIAIDPELPQARDRAARWRAAGYEIAAMARLPGNAGPSDVEAAYDAAFETLPETVALLDAGGAGLTADKAVTAQALERLAQDGRGLAALSEGLATPLRQAAGQGVPAVEIYRDLGQVGQDDRVIRRFLDQAAFRARQQGAVALMGRLNPETITALTLWGNRTDREGVAPAPLSALLQMQGTGLAK